MAPQQKKTASPKKIAAKRILLIKTTPKKTGSKTMASKKMSPKKKTLPKKVAPMKSAPKKVAPKKTASGKDAIKELSYELDRLLITSPASASVLDIMTASGSRTLPNEAFAEVLSEDDQAGGSKKEVGYELDALPNQAFAPVSDTFAASGSRRLLREAQVYFSPVRCLIFLICISRSSPMSWTTCLGHLLLLPASSTSWLHLEAVQCPTLPVPGWLAAELCPGKPLLRTRRLWKLVRAPFLMKMQTPPAGKPRVIFQKFCLAMFVF